MVKHLTAHHGLDGSHNDYTYQHFVGDKKTAEGIEQKVSSIYTKNLYKELMARILKLTF